MTPYLAQGVARPVKQWPSCIVDDAEVNGIVKTGAFYATRTANGCVLWLPLWYLQSSPMLDVVSNISCTATGAIPVAPSGNPPIQGCWGFDGIDDYITIPKTAPVSFQRSTNFTWIFWAKVSTFVPQYQSFLSEYNSTNYKLFGLRYDNIYVDYGGYSGNVAAGLVINTWYQFALTHIANTDNYLVYLNDALISTLVSTGSGANTNNILLGCSTESFGPLSGFIGEAVLYNQSLTLAQIQQDYLTTKWRYGP